MNILGVIPSRYMSSRFPGKPLADIGGKTMIQRVYEQAKKSHLLNKVVVATDNQQIFQHVNEFGGLACMTSENHKNGTDRCFEALSKEEEIYDYVINIQGDEPFIDPSQIDLLAKNLDGHTQIATLAKRINKAETLFNPNIVKVIFNRCQEAVYFSREAVPHVRGEDKNNWINLYTYFKHIGIYAYRTDILKEITLLNVSKLEETESLEQLRWMDNGYKIKVIETELETLGIDTPDDLAKALKQLPPS